MTERTCRTCVHCRPRYYTGRNWAHDRCEMWGSTTMHAVGFANQCGRQRRKWTLAPWHRRVVVRLITALERLGVLR